MEIDARSVVAVSGIAVGIALILSILIAKGRWREGSFTWLMAGNALFLVAVVSITARDLIAFEIAALLAIAGALYGIIFSYFAVLAFDNRPVPLLQFVSLGVVIVSSQAAIAKYTEDIVPLLFSSSLINGLLTGYMTAHVWRILRSYGVRVAGIVSLPFAIISCGYFIRLVLVTLMPDGDAPLIATVLIVSVMALAAVVLQIGFLALDESRSRQMAAEALAAAQDTACAKSRFMRAISHEIRTPLNGILGLSELMRSGAIGPLPEPGASFAEEIHSSGTSLLDMFDAIINISAMEAGGLSLTEEAVDLIELIKRVHDDFEPKFGQRRVVLDFCNGENTPEEMTITADSARLSRAVASLLDNALKYTAEDGMVTVSVRRTEIGEIEIAVQDDGPGIAPEAVPLALTLFGRVGGIENPANGAGVGLTLAAEIAKAHGGRLDLKTGKGRGLRAVVSLPASRLIPPRQAKLLSMLPDPIPEKPFALPLKLPTTTEA